MCLPGIPSLPRPPKERDCSDPADRSRRQITGQDSCRRPAKIIVANHKLKVEAEKAIEGWDEKSGPMPTRIVVTVTKRNKESPATPGNVVATVEVA